MLVSPPSHYTSFLSNKFTDNQLKEYTPNTAPGANLAKSIGPSAEFLQMPLAFNYR